MNYNRNKVRIEKNRHYKESMKPYRCTETCVVVSGFLYSCG